MRKSVARKDQGSLARRKLDSNQNARYMDRSGFVELTGENASFTIEEVNKIAREAVEAALGQKAQQMTRKPEGQNEDWVRRPEGRISDRVRRPEGHHDDWSRWSEDPPAERKPCRNILQGWCRFGANCLFSHVPVLREPSYMDVPLDRPRKREGARLERPAAPVRPARSPIRRRRTPSPSRACLRPRSPCSPSRRPPDAEAYEDAEKLEVKQQKLPVRREEVCRRSRSRDSRARSSSVARKVMEITGIPNWAPLWLEVENDVLRCAI